MEIYNEDVRDLLSSKYKENGKLELREHPENGLFGRCWDLFLGVFVPGLQAVTVTDASQVHVLMQQGEHVTLLS